MNPLDLYDIAGSLTEEERMVQDSVARMVDEKVLPVIQKCFEEHRFPKELIPELAGLGLLTFAAACGGNNATEPADDEWYSLKTGQQVKYFDIALGESKDPNLVPTVHTVSLAMAQDGMLPKVFGKIHPKTRAPWVAIVVCAIGWACCLGLGFARLVTIDILLYGASLTLEFVALVVLRVREPNLARPFRVPGGMIGAVLVGLAPILLLGFSIVRSQHEEVFGMSSFAFGMILIGAGVLAYGLNHLLKPSGWARTDEKPPAIA